MQKISPLPLKLTILSLSPPLYSLYHHHSTSSPNIPTSPSAQRQFENTSLHHYSHSWQTLRTYKPRGSRPSPRVGKHPEEVAPRPHGWVLTQASPTIPSFSIIRPKLHHQRTQASPSPDPSFTTNGPKLLHQSTQPSASPDPTFSIARLKYRPL